MQVQGRCKVQGKFRGTGAVEKVHGKKRKPPPKKFIADRPSLGIEVNSDKIAEIYFG